MRDRKSSQTIKRAGALRIARSRVAIGSVLLALTVLGCAESNFALASESRLPRWLTTQAGLTRGRGHDEIERGASTRTGRALQLTVVSPPSRPVTATDRACLARGECHSIR